MSACFCIGPQNGQPLCPCKMESVKEINGRYMEVIDHGPVINENKIIDFKTLYQQMTSSSDGRAVG